MPFRGTASFTAPRIDEAKAEREKNALSEEEKEAAYRDLYGLEGPSQEDPAVIDAQLRDLDEALGAIKDDTYWNNAQELCPDIANDRDFRLRFLRSVYYDVQVRRKKLSKLAPELLAATVYLTFSCCILSVVFVCCIQKAARRMLSYWKMKHELFGREKAYKKLLLSDLDDQDLATPRNRGVWVLPKRDRAGRAIVLSRKPNWVYEKRDNLWRWVWFIADDLAASDPAAQLKGVLAISFDDGPFSFNKFDRKLESKLMQMGLDCLPIRWVAVHVFYDSKVHEMLIPFVRFMLGKNLRARFLIYPGSKRKNRLERLKEVGMPKEMLPTIMGGDDEFDIAAWIEEQLEREKGEKRTET